MAATTRWRDTVTTNFDEAINSLIDDVVAEERQSHITWHDWNLQKVFEQNQHITLNGKDVEYNFVKFSFIQTTAGDLYVEDRSADREGFIIVYNSGSGINYIIDENSSAMKLLRRLLSYTGKNEIERNSFNFSTDFFNWLIYRVYHANYNIEMVPEGKKLQLDAIKGFKGDTDDLQTQVSASGETVMNIISTLSFLLESNGLNHVKLDLAYTGHAHISLQLQKGTVNVFKEDYFGVFEQEEYEQMVAKLYLMVYLEVLPSLFQEYNTDIEDGLWNQNVYIEFMKDVAQTLTRKVQVKISSLEMEEETEVAKE